MARDAFNLVPVESFGYDFQTSNHGAGQTNHDPSDFIPFREKPPAPTGVVVLVPFPQSLEVHWTDYTRTSPNDIGFYWTIRWCPATLVGETSNVWATGVLEKSKIIGPWVRAEGKGNRQSWVYADPTLSDGYIIVVGITDRGYVGTPSTPILMRISGNVNEKPDVNTVIPGQFTVTKERLPYETIRLDAYYFVYQKNDIAEFAGVHLHVVGWEGITTPMEIGSMTQWDGSTGANLITKRLPVEAGLGSGSAVTLTNGLGTANRVSGTAFDVAWIGRKIVFDYPLSSEVFEITGVTAPNLINFTPFFTGVTGNYAWKVLSNSTFYFVPIGKSGARVGDYTTANSVTI